MDNICRFVRTESFTDISILNFFYEKRSELSQSFITPAAYSLSAVTKGSGILHTMLGDHEISAGDLFVTFSAKPYYKEGGASIYLYKLYRHPRKGTARASRRGARKTDFSRL